MNTNLQKLYHVANQKTRRIIGLMSGTSLDGLDVALCEISGAGATTEVELVHFATISYTEDTKNEVRKVFAKREIDFQHLAMLNEWIGNLHAEIVLECLKRWQVAPTSIDAIASHGQTVMHAPKALHRQAKFPNATLQIGDGCHIAVKTGITTISDFRQKHLAAGGEGAPLAVYGDFFLFGKRGENRILLNMGGIANFTYLPATMRAEEVFVTDTGPGNTLIDAVTRRCFPQLSFDRDAALAKQGNVHPPLLAALKANAFFRQPFPKTTGPELFSSAYVDDAKRASDSMNVSAHDTLATLTRFSAETIAEAVHHAVAGTGVALSEFTIYLSGGGAHNPLLVAWLQELIACRFSTTDELAIAGDAKEAVLFAVLANETIAGGRCESGLRPGIPSVAMGKVSFPS
ncbi:MAG: anhydro-N-acetylmuramic acid kinase [Rhodocyclaceae bacterium]|jgi:anhydro-N-acetylmuramic acid kinase|nr:anhydro-N-acetylmuramic acid kinase [Rhodocyclaceae bacterium]MCE2722189.1 anhydro-N-acetylmuramic acid kinase [Betaproteobacteria bacterium]MCA3021068.1 anhydro-N-acetylmuramic acid kinase [Rhodocyclaceae bacterium]MCA3027251.1 anhydro-N-acetylmuramic acid kinase [Rhodocyclaceae bacterium]MCA3044385.1 anhydro-N-acetylmuramic acid kinase [Rhodocyclaceae bacterium]